MAASAEQELGTSFNPKLDASGLFTAVTVDADSEGLWSPSPNRPPSKKPLQETRKATYWSRSRQVLDQRRKSSNTQEVVSVTVDCDQDAVVVKVRQKGAPATASPPQAHRELTRGSEGGLG